MQKHKFAILSKFSTPQGVQSVLGTFYKNHFPATFGGHLEFLREMLKTLILETVRDRASVASRARFPGIFINSPTNADFLGVCDDQII